MKTALPQKPDSLKSMNCGLHLLIGATKSGKTLSALALAYELDFDFLYINEPRAATNSDFVAFYNNDGLLDRQSLFAGLATYSSKGIISGLIIDSIGDLFQSERKEQGLGKGLTFEQQLFFKKLQKKCFLGKIALIGTVNSALVPAISAFEGTVEGVLSIVPGGLLAIDRDERKQYTLDISKEAFQKACTALGYGTYIPKTRASFIPEGTFGVSGSLWH